MILAMATIKFILDRRAVRDGAEAPVKVSIGHQRKTALLPVNIFLTEEQWDAHAQMVVKHPSRVKYNQIIARLRVQVTDIIAGLINRPGGISGMTATQIKNEVQNILNPKAVQQPEPVEPSKPEDDPNTFLKWLDRFIARKKGRTADIYTATRSRLVAWLTEEELAKVKFEDIKVSWLEDFTDFLAKTNTVNAVAIHLRNVRAIVNYAIDNEVTTYYAFRRFKIKSEPTRKRNFDVETLRKIFNHTCEDKWVERYQDWFKLTFMFIGINVVDMFGLKKVAQGRIEYIRAKTHKPYSIKVEPEAQAILDKYKVEGSEHLLAFLDSYKSYRSFYMNLCHGLKDLKGQVEIDELTTYWARHSWATIARKIGISKDTIALALGHGHHDVTDIYIEYDMQEVDEANRKVLDYVLYGIDPKAKKKRGRPKKVEGVQTTPKTKDGKTDVEKAA